MRATWGALHLADTLMCAIAAHLCHRSAPVWIANALQIGVSWIQWLQAAAGGGRLRQRCENLCWQALKVAAVQVEMLVDALCHVSSAMAHVSCCSCSGNEM